MNTWHIHIKGQVQGVGFRPFVSLLAQQYQLKGWVNNKVDGVHIECNATENIVNSFLETLLKNAPGLSRITSYEIRQIPQYNYTVFEIKHSQATGVPNLLITPDAAICADCTKELLDATNRRKNYPFITCTNCGPRYSIIQELPYDRPRTTMDDFLMCSSCNQEYQNALNRRFHSQTNSCSECAIELTLYECKDGAAVQINSSSVIDTIVQLWQEGKIVAIKGVGGYLLTGDAGNEKVVKELRKRKHRLSKPFAIMFPNLEMIEQVLAMGKEERSLLLSSAAPIVLLQRTEASNTFNVSERVASSIAPKLNQVGAMLPYTPLYQLLLNFFDKPIVATSGNISNSPIIFDDKKALKDLSSLADFILINNRKIVVPQDDSVVKFTPFKRHKIILRRSRGYAPTYIQQGLRISDTTQVAMGAMLKSTFTLAHQGNVFISQYLGDLEHFDTLENYQRTVKHFLHLFQTQPKVILLDQHPQYVSSIYGKELAEAIQLPTISIPHHEAHFAAILGEHNLVDNATPILGVIWDGTGYGKDGHIWGGEFFVYKNHQFYRKYHLEYVPFIAGNKMPKEPRISALSFCWDIPNALPILKEKFTSTEWGIYNQLLAKDISLKTSSIGRLFDAVASILGILDKQTYEGEAAILLETNATTYFQENGFEFVYSSFDKNKLNFSYTRKQLISLLLADLAAGKSTPYIAAHFHFWLIGYIEQVAITQGTHQIAFSGGVFQNGLLVDLLIHHLGTSCDLYFHQELSPNDENVSFGQLVWWEIQNVAATV